MSFFLTSPTVIDLGVNIDHVATLRNARGTGCGVQDRTWLRKRLALEG